MQPKIYSIQDHRLSPDQIDRHAYYVIQKLKSAGYDAYLVGGGIRDLLLNRKPKDFDVSTSAKPEEIRALFRNSILIGKRFRLAHIRFGKKIVEVATFRSGDIETSALIVRDNDWGNAEEDALRRDFTINGLFYDPETGEIIDYVGGYPDVEKKVLRTIGQPEIRFRQDPVRMIRLLKFHARFGLDIDPLAGAALATCKEDITKSSQARILEELLRMLESGSSEPFFRYLAKYGLLKLLMPRLDDFFTTHAEGIYDLLKLIDTEIFKEEGGIERPLLISCLIYPMLVREIQSKTKEENRVPHLGIIAAEACHCIDQVFLPFFHLPRRLRGIVTSLLTSQFRFTPVQERLKRRMRIPRDPFFPLSLRFLKLRAALDPSLLNTYNMWSEAILNEREQPPRRRPPFRRRRQDART